MKPFKTFFAAAVLINALPLVADARQSTPQTPKTVPAHTASYCAAFNRGLFDICLVEAKADTRLKHACRVRYQDNQKQCQSSQR